MLSSFLRKDTYKSSKAISSKLSKEEYEQCFEKNGKIDAVKFYQTIGQKITIQNIGTLRALENTILQEFK